MRPSIAPKPATCPAPTFPPPPDSFTAHAATPSPIIAVRYGCPTWLKSWPVDRGRPFAGVPLARSSTGNYKLLGTPLWLESPALPPRSSARNQARTDDDPGGPSRRPAFGVPYIFIRAAPNPGITWTAVRRACGPITERGHADHPERISASG